MSRKNYFMRRQFTPKVKFSPEDDQRLIEIVREVGTLDWKAVASRMEGRNARQCRERWNNYANPEVKRDPWTAEEDALLETKYNLLGPRWHTIASFFPTRSTNQIKNRYFALKKKPKTFQLYENSNLLPNTVQNQSSPIQQAYYDVQSPSLDSRKDSPQLSNEYDESSQSDLIEYICDNTSISCPSCMQEHFTAFDSNYNHPITWVSDYEYNCDHHDAYSPFFMF